jgi:hypothetical protein
MPNPRFDSKFLQAFNPALIRALTECDLDVAYWAASHKKWRTKVTVTSPYPGAPPGLDNAMAWFPATSGVFGAECLSSILDDDGNLGPEDTGKVLGMIQIHRDHLIWVSWTPDLGNVKTIEWAKVFCNGLMLSGVDNDGGKWQVRFEPWYAGYPPEWPTWLLD